MDPAIRGRIEAYFASHADNIAAVYIFGSQARGDTTTASDIDLAVLFAEPPDATLAGPALTIEGQLERILGRPVDLLVLNSAPADVVHRVLRDGLVIFDPAYRGVLSQKTQLMNVDYSAFEGVPITGRADTVTLRGKVQVLTGKFTGNPTLGHMLRREPTH